MCRGDADVVTRMVMTTGTRHVSAIVQNTMNDMASAAEWPTQRNDTPPCPGDIQLLRESTVQKNRRIWYCTRCTEAKIMKMGWYRSSRRGLCRGLLEKLSERRWGRRTMATIWRAQFVLVWSEEGDRETNVFRWRSVHEVDLRDCDICGENEFPEWDDHSIWSNSRVEVGKKRSPNWWEMKSKRRLPWLLVTYDL